MASLKPNPIFSLTDLDHFKQIISGQLLLLLLKKRYFVGVGRGGVAYKRNFLIDNIASPVAGYIDCFLCSLQRYFPSEKLIKSWWNYNFNFQFQTGHLEMKKELFLHLKKI